MTNSKIQYLLITHLRKHGHVRLQLPDGVVLEIGIDQLDREGRLVPQENYCWVMASRKDRTAVLDSYNLGIRFAEGVVVEDTCVDERGANVSHVDVM